MYRAITDTNTIFNLAISPSLWLMPNNLIMIKNPIIGFNMNFGVNENLNKMDIQNALNTTAVQSKLPAKLLKDYYNFT